MIKKEFSIDKAVANLVEYGKDKLYLNDLDAIYARNQLMDFFKITEPATPDYVAGLNNMQLQNDILNPILEYSAKHNMYAEGEEILFETRIMGFVTPSPSSVVNEFKNIADKKGIEAATDFLNDISVDSNYIRMADISKNVGWTLKDGPLGDINVTINLSKPEKDNKQVAREKLLPQTSYPKCMLCVDCVGFPGNAKRPARQTLRVVPINLNHEQWYLQYSPYVYYRQHCIAFSALHAPMKIEPKTFTKLLDFVDIFPHFFIGSNADLPIVGGSILAHEHFQGGRKVLPMFSRPSRYLFKGDNTEDMEVAILNWYNSVIKLTSKDRSKVESLASKILSAWRVYNDDSANIIAQTDTNHNTITVIASKENNTDYSLYLILRNNRTDEQHPDGIFHPTPDMFNIKKEGIGLIEAMGTFILPGRLFKETKLIASLLSSKKPIATEEFADIDNPLNKHLNMISQLAKEYGTSMSQSEAEAAVTKYINDTCIKILNCTAVFKNTTAGQKSFIAFMESIGLERIENA